MWHSILSYHPRIGFTYTPSVKSRVMFEDGGYLVRTNAAGFRSDREFVRERSPGKFRAIVFGDSMTAGDGVANGERYSDLLEKAVPGLEVFNYGLTASGTDQQYLTYLEHCSVDHDLLVISPLIENITRANSHFLKVADEDGKEVFYAKPYYKIENDELVLHNIPVAKHPFTREALPSNDAFRLDQGGELFSRVTSVLRRVVRNEHSRGVMRRLAGRLGVEDEVTKHHRLLGYGAPDNPRWLLLRKIIETWIRRSPTPILLVPIPTCVFTEMWCDPTACQARFRELANDTGCFLHDPLPDLWSYTPQERRRFRFEHNFHLSPKGHQAMARSLAPVVERIMRDSRR